MEQGALCKKQRGASKTTGESPSITPLNDLKANEVKAMIQPIESRSHRYS